MSIKTTLEKIFPKGFLFIENSFVLYTILVLPQQIKSIPNDLEDKL